MTTLKVVMMVLAATGIGIAAGGSGAAPPALLYPSATLQADNTPYDGRFTFVRLRFTPSRGGFFGGRQPPWAHDYPRAERNLMRIIAEATLLRPYLNGGNILTADDPELFNFPVAYMSEPGYWSQTEEEVEGLRSYLLKGGFLIVDDFRGGDLYNFEAELSRVLPGVRLVPINESHPVFNAFFQIESLEFPAPTFRRYAPQYFGVFEDNDPGGRMLAVVNYNNDIGDYWEYSDTGFMPVALSNEAYKLGVNYIMYALTH